MGTLITAIIGLIVGCVSIGVMLSAPMGPIGILCVQRTLNNGRQSGFYTGIGAAISDLFYCMLTGLGLSIVTGWIEANFKLLEVIGSALLIAYAIYMIVHKPQPHVDESMLKGRKAVRRAAVRGSGLHARLHRAWIDLDDWLSHNERAGDVMTGFLLTLSNPLIIFLIIPLMARFEFPGDNPWYFIILGFALIVSGALLWWFCITFAVDKVRERVNLGSMWTINRIMGTILLIVAAYGMYDGIYEFLNMPQLNVNL